MKPPDSAKEHADTGEQVEYDKKSNCNPFPRDFGECGVSNMDFQQADACALFVGIDTARRTKKMNAIFGYCG